MAPTTKFFIWSTCWSITIVALRPIGPVKPLTAFEVAINWSLAKLISIAFKSFNAFVSLSSRSPLIKKTTSLPSTFINNAFTALLNGRFRYWHTSSIVLSPTVSTNCNGKGALSSSCSITCWVISILLEKSHLSHNTNVSSPIGLIAWNSSESNPPITPVSALTTL